MKIAAIDVGSNSVRLGIFADGKTLYKKINTTRLGEGLAQTGNMQPIPMVRTARAIEEFSALADQEGVDKFYAFATAAVRSAKNKADFLSLVKQTTGVDIDVISGKKEAEIGLLGALRGADGGIIDVGGASTEITVQKGGTVLYQKSVNLGCVRLHDLAGNDQISLQQTVEEYVKQYGTINRQGVPMYAIGGTATTIAALYHGLKTYDPSVVDQTYISKQALGKITQKLLSLSIEQIKSLDGMDPKRADVIGGGCLWYMSLCDLLQIDGFTVSESDNLEGYVLDKEGHL